MDDVLLVISTFPDAETAKRISAALVTEKLAACANLLPAIDSIYRWQGKLEESAEVMGFFKTTRVRFSAFESRLRAMHPYEVAEVIAVPIADGSPPYLEWVRESCSE